MKTVGSGLSERAIVQFDTSDPEDFECVRRAASDTLDRMSFERICKRNKKISKDILKAEGLPHEASKQYELDGELYSLDQVVLANGHKPDSLAMYAASILMMIEKAFALFREGDVDQALAAVFALGELVAEAGIKEVWEDDAIRGDKVLRAARLGHAMEHGDAAAVARRRQAQAASFERHLKQGRGKMDAYRAAADEHGVDPRTIQRAVKFLQS